MFSKTFGHALRASAYIAMHGTQGEKVSLQALSQQLEIPHPFLGKIMQDLVRNGIVDSAKGPNGGFYSNDNTLNTPLIEILKITDGSLVFTSCALGLKRCNPSHPCLLHHDFALCRDGMLEALAQKTIQDLTIQMADGLVFVV